jgi:hypothetical protein
MNKKTTQTLFQSMYDRPNVQKIMITFFKEYDKEFFNQQNKYDNFINIDSKIFENFIEDFKKNHLDKEPTINQKLLNSIFENLLTSKIKKDSKEIVLPNSDNLNINIIELNDLKIDITIQKEFKNKSIFYDISILLENYYKENLKFSEVNNFINSLSKIESFSNKNYEQNREKIKQKILSSNLIEKNNLIKIQKQYRNKEITLTNDEIKKYNHKLEKIIELEDLLNNNKGIEGPELS